MNQATLPLPVPYCAAPAFDSCFALRTVYLVALSSGVMPLRLCIVILLPFVCVRVANRIFNKDG